MEDKTVPQLVTGDITERYLVRRKIDQAIAHLEAIVDRLIDSQLSHLEYSPDYASRVVAIIRSLMPIRGALCDLRVSTYVWESYRGGAEVSDPTVQALIERERKIAIDRLAEMDRLVDAKQQSAGERYPITVGSHNGAENTDRKAD